MDMVNSFGLMAAHMMVNLLTTISMVMDLTNGLMEESTAVTGKIIKWRVEVFSNGLITDDMRVNTWMIKRKDMEYFSGPMEESMMVSGEMESKMELAHIPQHQVKQRKVNGKRERE